jgi:hypothetical protein
MPGGGAEGGQEVAGVDEVVAGFAGRGDALPADEEGDAGAGFGGEAFAAGEGLAVESGW